MRLILLFFITINVFGQSVKQDSVFGDCSKARILTISGNLKVSRTLAPSGNGEKSEIGEGKQRTKYAFEKEHHSAWYKLVINTNGHLCFNIIPNKKADDYDFMLFKGNRTGFCDSLNKYRIKPIRACISRDKEELDGKTGLSYKGKKEFVKEGVGDAFVAPLYVAKGETYYLVLDNVYDNGEGHSIFFYFEEAVKIQGVIVDENKKPIKADIALTNQKGDTMQVTASGDDGKYSFQTNLMRSVDYVLNFYNDSSFTYSKIVKIKDSVSLRDIRTVLPKLKKGVKYGIGSINFYGGSSQYITAAVPSLHNLNKLMAKNKSLHIKIIGHTNGCDGGVQMLSENRATAIKEFLIKKGIDASRMETQGMGCKQMLFQLPGATLDQQEQNRRVEVMVLEY